jgi:PAS domain S-box-containing protein
MMKNLEKLSKKNLERMTKAELIETLRSLQSATELSSQASDELKHAMHELEVHQVELEMQNRELQETQGLLEESRNRYADLYDFAPVAYVTLDRLGRIQDINLTGATMLGVERLLLIGAPFINYVDAQYRDHFLGHMQRCQSGHGKLTADVGLILKGGAVIQVELSSSPFQSLEKQETFIRTAITDITERQQARDILRRSNAELETRVRERTAELASTTKALREGEARIVGIINSAMDAIISVDEGQRIVLFNSAAERMFGYHAAEALGQPIGRLIPERFRVAHEQHIRRFGRTGETNRAMGALGAVSGVRRSGEEFPIEASISQIEISGQKKLFTVILRDVTARKRAEEELSEQAAMLNLAQDAIVVRDLSDRALFWNKSAERIYGWAMEEAVGHDVKEMQYRNSLSRFEKANQVVMEKGAWSGEMQQVARDGRELITDCSLTLVRDQAGNPKSILSINTDVTEKKKLELSFLRAQRLESIGTLASGIAHDLNNILSPILMGTQMLQMKPQDEQSQRLLVVMHTNAERGAEMIKQVLSFAKGIGGERVTIQPKHLIREIVRVVEETFPRSIEVTQRLCEDLWMVSGDATQLQQVLMNLCLNARDAMPRGGALTIEAENRALDELYAGMLKDASSGNYVVITISDTGHGIPPEIIDRIFDPFFTTKEPGRGTGLGLATVQGIVTGHGGFTTVESQPERGTKFEIYLPACEAVGLKQVEERVPDIPSGNGELILVIDDEAAVREMAGRILETFGYRVMSADNGATALAIFASHKDEIGVVITDMMMPVMDGLKTIRALQKLNPQVPVIASSGLTESAPEAELEQLGVRRFLVKPYNAVALLKTVAETLSHNR